MIPVLFLCSVHLLQRFPFLTRPFRVPLFFFFIKDSRNFSLTRKVSSGRSSVFLVLSAGTYPPAVPFILFLVLHYLYSVLSAICTVGTVDSYPHFTLFSHWMFINVSVIDQVISRYLAVFKARLQTECW